MRSRTSALWQCLQQGLKHYASQGAAFSTTSCGTSGLPGRLLSTSTQATSTSALTLGPMPWPGSQLRGVTGLHVHRIPCVHCTSLRGLATQQGPKSFGGLPAVTMQSLLITMIIGAAGIAAVKAYKDEKMQQVMTQSQQVVGKASVGGPFQLMDYNGKPFSDRDLRGEFALLYFGFTHCPDICPDELEKVSEAVTAVEQQTGVFVVPVFISVDPERDTPNRIKKYVTEFHPKMLGLTGDLEDIKKTSKAYRVYYSKTGEAGAKDYLVDHSIIHYLIDPEGEFVTFYAKNYTAEQMTDSLVEHLANWKKTHPQYHPGKDIKPPAPKAA